MTLQIIEEFRTAPEYARLRKLGATAASIWLLFLIVFSVACSAGEENVSRLGEAERVLRGATELRSYSERNVASRQSSCRRLRQGLRFRLTVSIQMSFSHWSKKSVRTG